jgi:hypothetical protein
MEQRRGEGEERKEGGRGMEERRGREELTFTPKKLRSSDQSDRPDIRRYGPISRNALDRSTIDAAHATDGIFFPPGKSIFLARVNKCAPEKLRISEEEDGAGGRGGASLRVVRGLARDRSLIDSGGAGFGVGGPG